MLDNLGFDDARLGRRSRLTKIDLDDRAAANIRGRQRLDRLVDPDCGMGGKIKIAIGPLDNPLGPERGKTFVNRSANGAEFDIGGVAEREHAKFDSVEPWGVFTHQLRISARRAGGRLAFPPGRRDKHKTFGARKFCNIEISHVDNGRLESILACGFRQIAGELLGIPRFARKDDR